MSIAGNSHAFCEVVDVPFCGDPWACLTQTSRCVDLLDASLAELLPCIASASLRFRQQGKAAVTDSFPSARREPCQLPRASRSTLFPFFSDSAKLRRQRFQRGLQLDPFTPCIGRIRSHVGRPLLFSLNSHGQHCARILALRRGRRSKIPYLFWPISISLLLSFVSSRPSPLPTHPRLHPISPCDPSSLSISSATWPSQILQVAFLLDQPHDFQTPPSTSSSCVWSRNSIFPSDNKPR